MARSPRGAYLFAISIPLLFGFWLVFVGTTSTPELVLGFVAAVIGGVAIGIAEQGERLDARPAFSDWVRIVHVPGQLVKDTFTVFAAAITGRAVSAFRVVSFDAGAASDPNDAARRVLAVVYPTMTPNLITFGINRPQRQLVFHQIKRTPVSSLLENLGARP